MFEETCCWKACANGHHGWLGASSIMDKIHEHALIEIQEGESSSVERR